MATLTGGHTLRVILAAQQEEDLPEQYVEFEVITGLTSVIAVAEARNTSVALDMRTMEEMKGSYAVLKETLSNVAVGGDLFFNRVEFKMNAQLEEKNAIDVRTLISIFLMFNQDLYPVDDKGRDSLETLPMQMYGGKEAALKKYLELGGGDPKKRDESIRKMAPIFEGIVRLWDSVERELPTVQLKKYKAQRVATSRKNAMTMFSNQPMELYVPQSITFPVVAAFRALTQVAEDGTYFWASNPIETWGEVKGSIADTVLNELKSFKGNANVIVKNRTFWHGLHTSVLVSSMHKSFQASGIDG